MRNLLLISLLVLLAACSLMQTTSVENKVKAALAKDDRTAGFTFDVSCDEGGTVTITGDVDLPATYDLVTTIATAVPGVKKVLNRCNIPEPGSSMLQDMTADTPAI